MSFTFDLPFFIGIPLALSAIFALFVLFCLPFAVISVWLDTSHPCIAYGEPTYHAPVYVMVGKVMMPTGGGTYADCVARK